MLVGNVRVSKADGSQATDLQRDALHAAGVNARHIYEDTASGKRDDRPGLAACLKALREKDTLVVWMLDRLGRDLRHLVNTVHEVRPYTVTSRPTARSVRTGESCCGSGGRDFGSL
jgi:DNA invertase Pin-like site-specific DNA recombinase